MLGESARGLFPLHHVLVSDFFLLFNLNPFSMLHLRTAHPTKDAHPACPELLGERASRVEGFFSDDFFCYYFHYPVSFHILPHSFALTKNSTLLFSSNSALFGKNMGGGGSAPPYLKYGSNFEVHQQPLLSRL